MWFVYRSLFSFPVWFDETMGKAIFFGFPVWLYITATNAKSIANTFRAEKLHNGLLLGIAVGGMFGFVVSVVGALQHGGIVPIYGVFNSTKFWGEFTLALFTGFWETLLFFSFVMTAIQEKFRTWSINKQVLTVAFIFTLFHLPQLFLVAKPELIPPQVVLFFAFAAGQAYLFASRKNGYALALSHAIWGMALLVHAG